MSRVATVDRGARRRSWVAGALALAACGPAPSPSAPSAERVNGADSAEVKPASGPAPEPTTAPSATAPEVPTVAPAGSPMPSMPPPIPPGTAVLMVGDSFTLAGFAQALRPRMQAVGARYEVKAETSSFTTTWAGRMELLIANTQPDLVIINLGANEVGNSDPSAHAPHVRRIVRAIGSRPCVWVSPPLWKKDTGIVDVIRENSAPCRFFDSDALVKQPIARQSDHIHPNEQGGAVWAEAFWSWLQAERAPAEPESADDKSKKRRSPWTLKPAPPEEHRARGKGDGG